MDNISLSVKPGICGFNCMIKAQVSGKRIASIEIAESDCTMIQKLSRNISEISMHDLFVPLTKNPIFIAAEQAGCHLACPVPVAVVKACEVILGLAIQKNVSILFQKE
jgi:hypothetical protein